MAENSENNAPLDFIREIVAEDLRSNKNGGKVITRFPPEPNGYLHIGHAKAICLDFVVAAENNGRCHLRFDDTNPTKEDTEYVESIINDVKWLGFDFGEHLYYASDYFERMYECAVTLIRKGLAYVCDLSPDEWDEYRGNLSAPGRESPGRSRSVEENLALFERMKAGEFEDGAMVLRARIDMASPNIHMRDPVIYRIRRVHHFRHGDKWCIYPMYDFAHPLEDAFEGVTHSFCTLEFEIHRPLYNWVVEHVSVPSKPRQIEFARLNITYTVLSKRFLRSLVESGKVDGWDDPRMPTLRGLRRRGFTGESIVDFITKVGVSKADSLVDIRFLDACIRDELNEIAPRRVAVLNPIKVVVDNYPEGKEEFFELPNHPQKPEMGTRRLKFTREIYIDAEDFAEVPPPKFFRMKPDGEVRLMGGYIVKCTGVEKNPDGTIKEIHCTADLETGNGNPADGRKIKGTIHWLSASDAIDSTVILYNNLLTLEEPSKLPEGKEYSDYLNPESRIVLEGCKLEPSLADAKPGEKFQFVRTGYFCVDTKEPGVFNRTVTLKDGFKPAK